MTDPWLKPRHSPATLTAPAPQSLATGPDVGEYSWGAGLVPPGNENLPPDQGGRYTGKCPPVTPPDDGGGSPPAPAHHRRSGRVAPTGDLRRQARLAAFLNEITAEQAARHRAGEGLTDGAGSP